MSSNALSRPKPAMVVFVDHHECRWLRCLKRGFRHCFVLLRDGDDWLLCDPLKDHMVLARLPLPHEMDLADHYVRQGHRVLIGRTAEPGIRRGPLISPLTCVAVVKRLLGLRCPLVLTPWQLHSHLRRHAEAPFVEQRRSFAARPTLALTSLAE